MEGGDGGRGYENPPSPPAYINYSSSLTNNDGTLSAIVSKSVRSLNVPLQQHSEHTTSSSHNDEMLSWLHYPMGDSLDRGYCSNIFGDLPTSSAAHRHSVTAQLPAYSSASIFSGIASQNPGGRLHRCSTNMSRTTTTQAMESCGSGPAEASSWAADTSRPVAGADAVVVALDGVRVAPPDFTGSHLAVEVLSKVDSEGEVLSRIREPSLTVSSANVNVWPLRMHSESNLSFGHASAPHQAHFSGASLSSSNPLQPAMDFYPSQVLSGRQAAINFPLFSRPAVETKANLHVLRESSGPTNIDRVRQQSGQQGVSHGSPATPNSKFTRASNVKGCGMQVAGWLPLPLPSPLHYGRYSAERSIGTHSKRLPPPLPPPQAGAGAVNDARDGDVSLNKDTIINSKLSSNAVLSPEKAMETADQTSPTQCSVSSTERSGKVTDTSTKRKRVGEESDYQSEETAVDKKSPSASKRSRTAEAHNQSEKKRRVKINDKLRTLQDLVPSSNKPDKASLLDAVIEYIKLLQSQLQVMSVRTGIGIPSWMIPNVNMQHLQMPALSPMRFSMDMGVGMGLSMGMRMGMGLMDANAAAAVGSGCAILPVPQFTGQPQAAIPTHPGDRLLGPGIVNPHTFYVAASPVQHSPMNLNLGQSVPMYNPYISRMQLQPQPPLHLQPQAPTQPQQRPQPLPPAPARPQLPQPVPQPLPHFQPHTRHLLPQIRHQQGKLQEEHQDRHEQLHQ